MNGFPHFLVSNEPLQTIQSTKKVAAKTKFHRCYCLAIISLLDLLYYYNKTLTQQNILIQQILSLLWADPEGSALPVPSKAWTLTQHYIPERKELLTPFNSPSSRAGCESRKGIYLNSTAASKPWLFVTTGCHLFLSGQAKQPVRASVNHSTPSSWKQSLEQSSEHLFGDDGSHLRFPKLPWDTLLIVNTAQQLGSITNPALHKGATA